MSGVLSQVDAAVAILRRDVNLYMSYRLRLLGQVVTLVFGLALFYYVSKLVRVEPFDAPGDYYEFVIVGLVILGLITATIGMAPMAIRQELVAGTFERLLVSPFGAVGAIVSMMMFPVLFSVVSGVFMLAAATLIFGVDIEWSTAPLAIPAGLLGVLAFLPLGLLVAAAVVVVKQASAIGDLIVAAMSITAGLYFPIALLPSWIAWLSDVQPFTPAVELFRHLLVDTPIDGDPWVAGLKLLGWAVVLTPLALWALSAAVNTGRRRGTITEY